MPQDLATPLLEICVKELKQQIEMPALVPGAASLTAATKDERIKMMMNI